MAGEEDGSRALDLAARILASFLSNCEVREDGTVIERRVRVAEINGAKITVRPDEHAPPHFHVEAGGREAAFTIADCSRLSGNLRRREECIVKYWYDGAGRQKVTEVWNNTRPGDCCVGLFVP